MRVNFFLAHTGRIIINFATISSTEMWKQCMFFKHCAPQFLLIISFNPFLETFAFELLKYSQE